MTEPSRAPEEFEVNVALEPCPFCGGVPVGKWDADADTVYCRECEAKGPYIPAFGDGGRVPDERRAVLAIAAWNRRSATPASPATLRQGTIETTHPEGTCERCGGGNVTWFAPSPLWNAVVRTPGYDHDVMLCPVCFIVAAEAVGFKPSAWQVRPEEPAALSPSSPREPSEAVVEMMARRDYENDWPTPPHDTWEETDEETQQDYRDDARDIIVKLLAIDFPPSGHET